MLAAAALCLLLLPECISSDSGSQRSQPDIHGQRSSLEMPKETPKQSVSLGRFDFSSKDLSRHAVLPSSSHSFKYSDVKLYTQSQGLPYLSKHYPNDDQKLSADPNINEGFLTKLNRPLRPNSNNLLTNVPKLDPRYNQIQQAPDFNREHEVSDSKHPRSLHFKSEFAGSAGGLTEYGSKLTSQEYAKDALNVSRSHEPLQRKRRRAFGTRTIFNNRRRRRQTSRLIPLKFVFLLPYQKTSVLSLPLTQAAISLAFNWVNTNQLLPGYDLKFEIKDSACSVSTAMNEAIQAVYAKEVNVFIGPTTFWNIPLISPGALSDAFAEEASYPLLIRTGPNFRSVAKMTLSVMDHFGWKRVKFLYDPDGLNDIMDGFCRNAAASFFEELKSDPTKANGSSRVSKISGFLDGMESEIGNKWSVIMLCANAEDVREIMIKAHELNYDNGDYVFINLDLFSSKETLEQSWYRADDTPERNAQAQKAFEALMTLTLKKPGSQDYRRFSREVKNRAMAMVPDFDNGEEEVNFFVGAFHDSVLLYVQALKETLAANLPIADGTAITRRMLNKTFEGIAGTVSIDASGDRQADFSLLDLNPATKNFEVVANYFGNLRQYEPVMGKTIHWGGARKSPPLDTPPVTPPDASGTVCAYNDSVCPDTDVDKHTECDVGYYGNMCNKSCSVNCAGDNHPCDRVNGSCDQGCAPGYQGALCTQDTDIAWHTLTYSSLVGHSVLDGCSSNEYHNSPPTHSVWHIQ
ncbi:guanylate cyclase [Elysia marginata]|uniref:Guanylate cyclase n=1 Tax=Elysia marginata TaxID=1093978 RepID=A0AAV4H436_9GAST|nr:guanylate cyclase [Elysia marginata]